MNRPEGAPPAVGTVPARELTIRARRLDRQVRGGDIAVGGRMVQPVARLSGWYDGDANAQGEVGWGWVKLTPKEVVVRDGDGTEQHVAILDTTAATLRSLAIAALGVVVVSWLVGKWVRRSHSSGGKR